MEDGEMIHNADVKEWSELTGEEKGIFVSERMYKRALAVVIVPKKETRVKEYAPLVHTLVDMGYRHTCNGDWKSANGSMFHFSMFNCCGKAPFPSPRTARWVSMYAKSRS